MVVPSSIYGNVRAGSDCGDGHSAVLNLFFLPRSLEQVRLPLSERVSLGTVLWGQGRRRVVFILCRCLGWIVPPLLEGMDRGRLHMGHVSPTVMALSSEPGSVPWPSAPRASFLFLCFILFLLL